MLCTCANVAYMSKMIQIRNVPDEVHREVKVRAARAGMTLSDFLLREVQMLVAAPSVEDVLAEVGARKRPRLSETPAQALRAERSR